MSLSAKKSLITPQDYLALEHAAEFRNEYYDGRIYAMSGASLPHNRIVRNLAAALNGQLGDGPCEVLATDMRVALGKNAYVYPDLVIICGEPELLDEGFDTLLNPQVIIEVLSPSTAKWDRGGKFTHYQQVATLRHYILVAQEAPAVERHDRQPDNTWLQADVAWPDGVLTLASIGVAVSIQDIYARVFPPDHPA